MVTGLVSFKDSTIQHRIILFIEILSHWHWLFMKGGVKIYLKICITGSY